MIRKDLMMDKRGLSHVEMILSFVIFFSFLMFVYIYLVPHIKIVPDYPSLNNAEKLIIKHVEMNVDFFSLALNVTKFKDCFSVDNFGTLNWNVLVKNKDGETVSSQIAGILRISLSGNFYYIYFSEDFEASSDDLNGCGKLDFTKGEYELGSKRSETWASFEKLKRLNESYNADYAGLKETLGIKQDFAFSLTSSSGEVLIKADREKPVKNVLAKESVAKVYNKNNIENDVLTILVW